MKTDVAVIGGGLVGAATAYYLASEGAEVLLIEAGDLNTKASGTNAGSIHLQIAHAEFVTLGEAWARRYAPTLRLLKASLQMWQGLGEELGVDLDVKLTGGLLVATTDEQMRQIAAKAAIERAEGVETEVIDRETIRDLAPYLSERAIGAGFCAMEGKANPLRATPAYAEAAQARGTTIWTDAPVTAIDAISSGYRLETARGPVAARRVVNAAGAQAAGIAAMLGVTIGLQGFPLQVTVTEPIAPLISHLVYSAAQRLSAKQAANGTCLIGGGWPARRRGDGVLVVDPASITGNMATAAEVIPALAQARAVRTWTATVNGTADWRPLIGAVPGQAGFFLALFPWMGFSAGPMTARLVADMVLGRAPRLPLKGISALED
jgi:sarcosine oxidase, subunit beta